MPCCKKKNPKKPKNPKSESTTDETSALIIGEVAAVTDTPDKSSAIMFQRGDEIILDHHIFNTRGMKEI